MREIIVCKKCKCEDCRVDELLQTEKVSMDEYIQRHKFPKDVYSALTNYQRTARRFVITCQTCGYQVEFQERVEPPPVPRWEEFQTHPDAILLAQGISTDEDTKVGAIR